MYRLLLFLPLFLLRYPSYSQLPNTLPKDLPDSLLRNAHVVKISEEMNFRVKDIDKAELFVSKVFTVLSDKGKDALFFNEYSNRFIKLDDAEIIIYDPSGKTVEKIKKKQMQEVAVGEGLIEDGTVTYYKVNTGSYPVTVSMSYTILFSGTLFYPEFDIQHHGEALLHSKFTATVPASLGLRYKEQHIRLSPKVETGEKYHTYTWEVANLPAPLHEDGGPHPRFNFPKIILAPNKFRIYGTDGDMSSWQNFGKWEYQLAGSSAPLTEGRVQFFREMVKNAGSDREKAAMLYKYLQNNFRYVSIQLGIGSYKPFPASFTDEKKYGDCKGLSFYMHQMLNAVGIRSHLALINAGYNSEPADPDFPCNQFNHMILCIPRPADTIWLECTSKHASFGVLGTFTENRNALLITEEGGKLVATPSSMAASNEFSMVNRIELLHDGSAEVNATIKSSGEFREMVRELLVNVHKDKQKQFLIQTLGIRQPDDFLINATSAADTDVTTARLLYSKIPEFTAGSKWFLSRSFFRFGNIKLPDGDNRRLDYYFHQPFIKKDTTIYQIPDGFSIDLLPDAINHSCAYAQFQGKCWFDEKERKLYSTSTLTLHRHKIRPADFPKVKQFFEDLKKSSSSHIVLVKKN